MTEDDKALVERLRDDWPEILVEKHWMMDSDAIDKQREEAADRIEALSAQLHTVLDRESETHRRHDAKVEALSAENEKLRGALEDFVACVGVSDDPDILMVDARAYENATRVLGVQG